MNPVRFLVLLLLQFLLAASAQAGISGMQNQAARNAGSAGRTMLASLPDNGLGGLGELARLSKKRARGAAAADADAEKAAAQGSPIDYDHIIGADYTKAGRPTGGHTLLNGDVKIVPGTESIPDAFGVYKATIQVPDPRNPGQWITKTSNGAMNTMFPKDWDEMRIKSEVDAAWNSPHKVVTGSRWRSVTPSGVRVEGFTTPRVTVYPVYRGARPAQEGKNEN